MSERRYGRYKRSDVESQLFQHRERLNIELIPFTVYGISLTLVRLDTEEEHRAAILARSSDWYSHSLNCTDSFLHRLTAVVCGTHDSCIPVPVLAMDSMRWYGSGKMRSDLGTLAPALDSAGDPIPDAFDRFRKSAYGHKMFVGALMMRRPDALMRLATLKQSTRLRIEAEMRYLSSRRPGRPLKIWPVDQPHPKPED